MKVVAIAAVARNGVIGDGLNLPWSIPEDMKFFRSATRGQVVIMGRKTYTSLGKALPQRENAIVTRNLNYRVSDANVFHDVKTAIDFYRTFAVDIIFVIGGAQIYELAIPYLDEIWLTEIDFEAKGDIVFPHFHSGKLHLNEFEIIATKNAVEISPTLPVYKLVTYKKRINFN